MKSKFLYQDVDVVSLADKCIVVRCFVCRNYDMETGKLCDNIRVTDESMNLILILTHWNKQKMDDEMHKRTWKVHSHDNYYRLPYTRFATFFFVSFVLVFVFAVVSGFI